MYVRCVVYVGKWLLVELHIKQTFIIIIITPLSDVFLVTFLKLHSSRHPTVTTLRPAADDGVGTVLHGFKSGLTRAASRWFLVGRA